MPSGDRLPVQEGAVARALVDDGPALRPPKQLCVVPRDLVVPGERDVLLDSPADADPGLVVVECDDVLLAGAVVKDDERAAASLGLDPVVKQCVGARQLAGLGERDPELDREVTPGGILVA